MTDPCFSSADALMYDEGMSDWPGEIDYYLKLANTVREKGQAVLDIACGTGRVALQLAQTGVRVVGMDLAADMLALAQKKSQGLPNVSWVLGDMRAFDLGERFGLVIIPVHSFQFMLSPQDQVECLECIRRHLLPNGLLVIHVDQNDPFWLGGIRSEKNPQFEYARIEIHPQTGARMRAQTKWVYERSTQTATLYKIWEEIGEEDTVINRLELEPMPMHVVFCFEMEHLLNRVGLQILNTYGDFYEHPYAEDSSDMIWLALQPVSDSAYSNV
jgi:ubiquinone/menaquinone biosynthesis C-methylase UbiE